MPPLYLYLVEIPFSYSAMSGSIIQNFRFGPLACAHLTLLPPHAQRTCQRGSKASSCRNGEVLLVKVMRVLEPAALEAAAPAARQRTEKEDEVLRVLSLELQAAWHEAEWSSKLRTLSETQRERVVSQ